MFQARAGIGCLVEGEERYVCKCSRRYGEFLPPLGGMSWTPGDSHYQGLLNSECFLKICPKTNLHLSACYVHNIVLNAACGLQKINNIMRSMMCHVIGADKSSRIEGGVLCAVWLQKLWEGWVHWSWGLSECEMDSDNAQSDVGVWLLMYE